MGEGGEAADEQIHEGLPQYLLGQAQLYVLVLVAHEELHRSAEKLEGGGHHVDFVADVLVGNLIQLGNHAAGEEVHYFVEDVF